MLTEYFNVQLAPISYSNQPCYYCLTRVMLNEISMPRWWSWLCPPTLLPHIRIQMSFFSPHQRASFFLRRNLFHPPLLYPAPPLASSPALAKWNNHLTRSLTKHHNWGKASVKSVKSIYQPISSTPREFSAPHSLPVHSVSTCEEHSGNIHKLSGNNNQFERTPFITKVEKTSLQDNGQI